MKRRRTHEIGSVSVEGFGDLERIGSGGFSVVYRARQLSMNREVAIKVLNSGFATEAERRTFERECHALGQLSHHPNIVTVFNDAVTTDGRPCIVMELYRTTYREQISERGTIPISEALSMGVRVAGALHVAHGYGVLHRDIKPHNIFVSQYGEPALGDFGISTLDDERSHSGASGLSVAYAAPEILEDAQAEVASDVYALAATLYHIVAGVSPFAANELRTTVRRILTEAPAAIDRADAPPGLSRILIRTMSKDPADRPESAYELAEMLREVQARAGLERTPIPMVPGTGSVPPGVEAPPPSGDPLPGVVNGLAAPPPPIDVLVPAPPAPVFEPASPAPAPAPPDADDRESGGSTIARARATPPPPGPVDDSTRNRRRARIALGAAVVAVLLLVAGVFIFGDDGGSEGSSTTVTQPEVDFVPHLASPENVRVLQADQGYNVHFQLPDNATGAMIEIRNGTRNGEEVRARSSPHFIKLGAASLCVEVIAIGEEGRRGGASDLTCSD